MLSTQGLSRLRPVVESIISVILRPTEKVVFVNYLPYYLSSLIAKVNGIQLTDCVVNSHLEKNKV